MGLSLMRCDAPALATSWGGMWLCVVVIKIESNRWSLGKALTWDGSSSARAPGVLTPHHRDTESQTKFWARYPQYLDGE